MASRLVNIDRKTPLLLPPDLQEWVRGDDLAHFLVDAVELLDWSAARVNDKGTGSEQYPPGMMLIVLLYCYAHGIFSSRRIEQATYQHVSVRFLSGDTHPDHDTIASFRRENGPLIRSAFQQILQLAQQSGLPRLGSIAVDGTRLWASARKGQSITYERLEQALGQLDEQITQLLKQAEAADQNAADPGSQLPARLQDARQRREVLQAAKTELERRVKERAEVRAQERKDRPPGDRPREFSPTPRAQEVVNLTDPQSHLMPHAREGFIQGYNAQVAVEVKTGLIVAAAVTQQTNDTRQLQPMVQRAAERVQPEYILADSGYEHSVQIRQIEAEYSACVLCPPVRNPTGRSARWEPLAQRQRKHQRRKMRRRLRTAQGRRLYALRKGLVEPVFGIIKSVLGFRRFNLRGLANVSNEWNLVSLAFNCKRMVLRNMAPQASVA